MILLPAIWNGFPFVFPDTGGYLLRPFAHDLELGRSALYGAFLAAGLSLDFWPDVAIQALLSAWIISLVARSSGLQRPSAAFVVIAALCLSTSLPWYADQLMPDIFVPLAVLAIYLIAFAATNLRRWETASLIAVIAFAVAFHMSICAVLLLLFAVIAVLWVMAPAIRLPQPRLFAPALGIALGIVLALSSNYVIAGTAAFTPGGSNFLFARMLEDGFVKSYLDHACGTKAYSLCAYRDSLPSTRDDWLWDDDGSPLAKLGGWRKFAPEASRIVAGSLMLQPLEQLRAVARGTLAQLEAAATGDGFEGKYDWHTEWVFKTYAPKAMPAFRAAAEQRGAIDFHLLNLLQLPLAISATLLLPCLFVICWRCRTPAATLVLTALAALLANAIICAMFSGIADRYQSRIIPVAVLADGLAGYELLRLLRRSKAAISTAA